MRKLRLLLSSFTTVVAVMLWLGHATGGPLDDLVAAARNEGAIHFYGPSTLTPEGARAITEAFNKKYGLNVKLHCFPSDSMTRDVGRVATHAAAGAPPEWDVMVVTDAHHASLWLRRLHKPFNYRAVGIDPELIDHDSGSISFLHQYVVPVYNSNLVSPRDVPKRWEDLLDPKWKGRLGVSTATHHFARLAAGPWGEEKTTAYVRALAQQNPMLGRIGETYSRLQLGEIAVAFGVTDSFVLRAQRTGAPIAAAEEVELTKRVERGDQALPQHRVIVDDHHPNHVSPSRPRGTASSSSLGPTSRRMGTPLRSHSQNLAPGVSVSRA